MSEFISGYIECLLWCGVISDEDGTEHIDEFTEDDISEADREEIRGDCEDFYEHNKHLWEGEPNYTDWSAGHDFYLTRNGHGAGFWDRGLKNGQQLTKAAHVYGSQSLCVEYVAAQHPEEDDTPESKLHLING